MGKLTMGKLATVIVVIFVLGLFLTTSSAYSAPLCTGSDDTAAFNAAIANGQTLLLPAGTCNINTLGYGSATVVAPGSGYQVADTITLTNGMVITVAEVLLKTISLNAAGSGYQANDVITLVGGQSDIAAQITVNTVSSGAIATFTITTQGSYTTQPNSFTSSGGHGSGATWNSPTWGVSEPKTKIVATTSTPASPVSQSSTSGSGNNATFQVEYTAIPLTADGQCIIGQGRSQTFITTSLSNYNLIALNGNNNCVKNLGFTLGNMNNGWAIHLYNANQAVVQSLNFAHVPGAIAITHGAAGNYITDIRINACSGGSISQVDPTGSNKAIIMGFGDGTNGVLGNLNTGPNFINNVVMGCSGATAVGMLLDGFVNSWHNDTIRVNSIDTGLVHEDTANTGGGPSSDIYVDFQVQTPASTLFNGGINILTGVDTEMTSAWVNASGADCVYIGPSAVKVFFNLASFSGCANSALEIGGTNVSVVGGQINNANNTNGCASCANVKLSSTANNVTIGGIAKWGGANAAYDINAAAMTSGVVYAFGNTYAAATQFNDPNHVISQNAPTAALTDGPFHGSSGAAIPSCTATLLNAFGSVSDGKASPTAGSNYAAGDGAANQPVWCNGTNWLYLM